VTSLLPFLKWAGGKRWLATKYGHLFPSKFERYIEPFLGSGAIYFYLRPRHALLSDANANLIETYAELRDNWEKVERSLERHHKQHSKSYYYRERNSQHRLPHERAAQFIYLNRTCWNGLYRVNREGAFNVPIGTKKAVVLESDDFQATSALLKGAEILTTDFEVAISRAKEGDFLFVDPPYVTRHNFNGFAKYNEKIFGWDDQIRLAKCIRGAAGRGAMILATNADHRSIRALYRGVGKTMAVRRRSVLAADSDNRGETTELAIIINYQPTNGRDVTGTNSKSRRVHNRLDPTQLEAISSV
jgi:DNA adenine methylase